MRGLRALLAVAALIMMAPAGAHAATAQTPDPAKKERGYITLPDGTQLRYSVWLPAGDGPFPVLMQYEGYQAGSDPSRANPDFVAEMLKKGYAVFGVSARGSACSSGTWSLFDKQQGEDGAYALDWAGEQPWSNGRVGLFSYSYGGIMQLWVAAMRPKHLVALAPGNVVTDTYRDISYPGGIPNVIFPPEWGVALQTDWVLAAKQAIAEGDTTCLANVVPHPAVTVTNNLALSELEHPFDDAWHHDHSSINILKRINVPLLGVRTWQDEETGGRQGSYWNQLDPKKTWLINSNGNHLLYEFSSDLRPTLEGFFDHFLKGVDNGFQRTPHVQIWHETDLKSNPRSITTQPRLPVKVNATPLYLGAGNQLGTAPGTDGTVSYQYPTVSPPVVDTSSQSLQETLRANTWSTVPYNSAGSAQFTTPPLSRTVTTYGPSSADLWVSTPAKDVDLQVTVTEVRPDGQEVYVQRGWLRASHRALDTKRSTPLEPYHLDTEAAQQDMPADTPQLLRVAVFPFGHTFRAGSSLRIYVDQPGVTGLWGFADVLTPQTVSVLYGADHPSRLMLGVLPQANVEASYPSCENLLNQACRSNPVPQPAGHLDPMTHGPAVMARAAMRRGHVVVRLRSTAGRMGRTTVLLRRGAHTVARGRGRLSAAWRRIVLRSARPLRAGTYTLVVRAHGRPVLRQRIRV